MPWESGLVLSLGAIWQGSGPHVPDAGSQGDVVCQLWNGGFRMFSFNLFKFRQSHHLASFFLPQRTCVLAVLMCAASCGYASSLTGKFAALRSEEHTSELQSPMYLV